MIPDALPLTYNKNTGARSCRNNRRTQAASEQPTGLWSPATQVLKVEATTTRPSSSSRRLHLKQLVLPLMLLLLGPRVAIMRRLDLFKRDM